MHKRQVLLEDGRYLIYYTFEETAVQSCAEPADPESEPGQRGGDADE